jgi:hypothetical protein
MWAGARLVRLLMVRVLALAALAAACSSAEGSRGGDGRSGEVDGAGDAAGVETPAPVDGDVAGDPAPDLPPRVEPWIAVEGSEGTGCSGGDLFRFFVRKGATDRVLVDFEGGGACWNALTCAVASATMSAKAPTLEEFEDGLAKGAFSGVLDTAQPENPFREWTLVHVPYCTGDIHWGSAVKEYADGLVFHHTGFANGQAVLSWVYENAADAAQVVVSGCSAGGYGALLHGAYAAKHYADAQVTILVDAAGGITTPQFVLDSIAAWGVAKNLPDWIPGLVDTPEEELTFQRMVEEIAKAYPEQRLAFYSTAHDQDQAAFYKLMGGDEGAWPEALAESLATLAGKAPNFRYFVPPGYLHCVTPHSIFFSKQSHDETRFVDWLGDLLDRNAEAPPSQLCQEEGFARPPDCTQDLECEACLQLPAEQQPFYCSWCDGIVTL